MKKRDERLADSRLEKMDEGLNSKMPAKEELDDTLKYVNFEYKEI